MDERLNVPVLCSQACAPRYIWFSVSQPKHDSEDNRLNKESTAGNRREPVGTCWVVSDSFNESQEFSPCRTSKFLFPFSRTLSHNRAIASRNWDETYSERLQRTPLKIVFTMREEWISSFINCLSRMVILSVVDSLK